ncbi:MAG: c-type cytochrome [Gemmatimonadota bacterium]
MMARLRTFRFYLLALLVGGLVACDATPPPVGMARGEELYETCAPCHGENGVGNVDIAAPTIAGLPRWYLEAQLESFQAGWRGNHHEDLPGLRMRPMAVSLTREGDIESVAEYVAALPGVYPESTLDGNAGAGAESYEVCVACHGTNGLGNEMLRSPPIVQMHDWYMLNQLRNFQSGARGAHPEDTWGQTMRVNVLAMSDQAMRDVIAYVQSLR